MGKTLLLLASGASRGVGRHSWALHTMDQGDTRVRGGPRLASRRAGLAASIDMRLASLSSRCKREVIDLALCPELVVMVHLYTS